MNYTIDAKGKRLGRLASEIAVILQGKKHATYNPRLRGEDRVLIKNAKGIVVTGEKDTKKIYYRHTGYMGHLREKTYAEAFAQSPEKVLRHAVEHMLPRNWIRAERMKLLKVEE